MPYVEEAAALIGHFMRYLRFVVCLAGVAAFATPGCSHGDARPRVQLLADAGGVGPSIDASSMDAFLDGGAAVALSAGEAGLDPLEPNPVAGSEGDLDVMGRDADQTGVRDDLESYLTQTIGVPDERAALTSYAREETRLLLLGADPQSTHAAVLEQAQRSLRVHRCVYDAVGSKRVRELIIRTQSALLNSEVRWRAWLAAEGKLRGVILRDSPCDQSLVRP